MENNKEILFNHLLNKYGTFLLNKKQMSEVTNQSESTLNRLKREGCGCEYKIDGGNVYYPIQCVVEYLSNVSKVNS